MNNELYQAFMTNPAIKADWGAAFLRDGVIADLLGSDIHSILYWAGKQMARRFSTKSQADLIPFFQQSGFGDLSVKNSQDALIEWALTGPIVTARLQGNPDADFMFEAGFLAQSAEFQRGIVAEAEIDKKQFKKGNVVIAVHLDPDNPADDFDEANPFTVLQKEQPQQLDTDQSEPEAK